MSDEKVIPQAEPAEPQTFTPDEYKKLVERGEAAIDARGRLRPVRPGVKTEGGVNLRKRRAWFATPQELNLQDGDERIFSAMHSLFKRQPHPHLWQCNEITARKLLSVMSFGSIEGVPERIFGLPVQINPALPPGMIELDSPDALIGFDFISVAELAL